MQRLFEQAWELSPLSMRNTLNGLLWIGGLAAYLALTLAIGLLAGRRSTQSVAGYVLDRRGRLAVLARRTP